MSELNRTMEEKRLQEKEFKKIIQDSYEETKTEFKDDAFHFKWPHEHILKVKGFIKSRDAGFAHVNNGKIDIPFECEIKVLNLSLMKNDLKNYSSDDPSILEILNKEVNFVYPEITEYEYLETIK